MRASCLLFALLVLSGQSQPPIPTPLKSVHNKKAETAPKERKASNDQANAQSISSAIDKLVSKVAGWKEQEAAQQNKRDPSSEVWSVRSVIASAVATLAIALFSFFQWRAMRSQRVAMEQQAIYMRDGLAETRTSATAAIESAELARQSIALSHRPKLIVRHVVVRPLEKKVLQEPSLIAAVAQTIKADGGEFYIANVGNSEARVTRVYSQVFRGDRLPMVPPYDGKSGISAIFSVTPGGYSKIAFPSEPYAHQTSVNRIASGDEFFWIIGWIEYIDSIGNQRRTGFCRKWDNSQAQFLPEANSPYEYAD